jgi:hypothetical protein
VKSTCARLRNARAETRSMKSCAVMKTKAELRAGV